MPKVLILCWIYWGNYWKFLCQARLQETGIRGIQDTSQIMDGNTNYIENNWKQAIALYLIL